VPIVLTEVSKDARLFQEESFGPVVSISPFHSEAGAIQMANESEFALAASVWTGDKVQGERVAARLQCGCCVVNDVIRHIGNPDAAFGGNRSSGYGRYHGEEGLKTFSRVKTVMTVICPQKTEIHWFPFRSRTFALVRGILGFRHGSSFVAKVRALMGLQVILLLLAWGCRVASASPVSMRARGQGRESISTVTVQCCRS
jgi:hypothetical protein